MDLDLIDTRFFPHPSGGTGTNAIISGVDMSSSKKISSFLVNVLQKD